MNDEFYIGWQAKSSPAIGFWIRRVVLLLLLLAVALGVLLASAQQTIGSSVFEWGRVKEFSGLFKSQPCPHLLVARPGADPASPAFSSYYLVKPFKFGLDAETVREFDGQAVRLQGTLIYRGNQTMIEVVRDSIQALDSSSKSPATASDPQPAQLGRQTLVGEIVDSKCYLGVMNPGALTPHRACAIRCISGGIPPVLLVRRASGPPLYFLLVSPEGLPVNKQILSLVAEPVEITGEVQRQGELLILRADPAVIRRVGS